MTNRQANKYRTSGLGGLGKAAQLHLASNEVAHYIAMYEVLIVAQLLAQDSSFQQWVDSRPPAELCELYSDKMIPDTMLPGGRDSSPCGTETFDDPMNYVIN